MHQDKGAQSACLSPGTPRILHTDSSRHYRYPGLFRTRQPLGMGLGEPCIPGQVASRYP